MCEHVHPMYGNKEVWIVDMPGEHGYLFSKQWSFCPVCGKPVDRHADIRKQL